MKCACGCCRETQNQYVRGHNPRTKLDMVFKKTRAINRFWERVIKTEYCWIWPGSLTQDGYGQHHDGDKLIGAHVFAWEQEHGPLNKKYELDHAICHNRQCVRPDHLQPVTHSENAARVSGRSNITSDKCPSGHQYPPGIAIVSGGRRRCWICAKGKSKKMIRL